MVAMIEKQQQNILSKRELNGNVWKKHSVPGLTDSPPPLPFCPLGQSKSLLSLKMLSPCLCPGPLMLYCDNLLLVLVFQNSHHPKE